MTAMLLLLAVKKGFQVFHDQNTYTCNWWKTKWFSSSSVFLWLGRRPIVSVLKENAHHLYTHLNSQLRQLQSWSNDKTRISNEMIHFHEKKKSNFSRQIAMFCFDFKNCESGLMFSIFLPWSLTMSSMALKRQWKLPNLHNLPDCPVGQDSQWCLDQLRSFSSYLWCPIEWQNHPWWSVFDFTPFHLMKHFF